MEIDDASRVQAASQCCCSIRDVKSRLALEAHPGRAFVGVEEGVNVVHRDLDVDAILGWLCSGGWTKRLRLVPVLQSKMMQPSKAIGIVATRRLECVP